MTIARRMARWCLETGQTPQTWAQLTRTERDAFTDLLKEARRA